MIEPRLYSISTVSLLKHYNQDYLLHELRTDFTGSNGVGKSIIADLFQIVFIADNKHIKFATEGIDKKKRRIESLPYQSGIGYVFFNVEVKKGEFVIIGAAIFSQGNVTVKPFIVTSTIDYTTGIEQNTFSSDKLLFCNNLLKSNGEAYTLDDLSRVAPDKYNLFVHSFDTKEDKHKYYDWLYKNELLPINLVKESNLKAYAKVIQSFSKSKTLDIDNSHSLIEYLFEQDEEEIEQDYKHQEQAIQKLLHQFKTTKNNINDITSKQRDLTELKKLNEQLIEIEYALITTEYILTRAKQEQKQTVFDKIEADIKIKNRRLGKLSGRASKLSKIKDSTTEIAEKENIAYNELVRSRNVFDRLEIVQKEINLLESINANGFMSIVTDDSSRLLKQNAHSFYESISKSGEFLSRYRSSQEIDKRKKEQDVWLRNKQNEFHERKKKLTDFKFVLENIEDNSFFIKALSSNKDLNKAQQATLIHLRSVFFGKPNKAIEGTRYTDRTDLLNKIEISEDSEKKGWWLKMGDVNEFVEEKSLLFPDLSKISTIGIEQLKKHLEAELIDLDNQNDIYEDLTKGRKSSDFTEYDFDTDLSDHTKISNYKLAAEYVGLIDEKIVLLNSQQKKALEEVEKMKMQYGITIGDVQYDALIQKINYRKTIFKTRSENFKSIFINEQNEIKLIKENQPNLDETYSRASKDLIEAKEELKSKEKTYSEKYPLKSLPVDNISTEMNENLQSLQAKFSTASGNYLSIYNQIISKYEDTKDRRNIAVNEQVDATTFSFEILEQALLGKKVRALDEITTYLESLSIELLAITDELLKSLVKVFGKTEHYYGRYKKLVQSLNDFFKGKLISDRFYFRIDFNPNPKLEIEWIEQLRKSAASIVSTNLGTEITPELFIEDFYLKYSGSKARIQVEQLLNPKSYFVLKGKLTDENDRDIPGSTGESYTAIALLGIARLSIVQDGDRKGLRFLILEESATLDNVNFGMFPIIAAQYGYQIITMTPKPYAIGGDDGWYIHQLLPGNGNRDINYSKVMSYFRTAKDRTDLDTYLKAKVR